MPRDLIVNPDFTPGEIAFQPIPRFLYRGSLASELAAGSLDAGQAMTLLEWMVAVRELEQILLALKSGRYAPQPDLNYGGAAHVCVGQEAVGVGAAAAMAAGDLITSTHRGHGHSIAKVAMALYQADDAALRDFIGPAASGSRANLLEQAADEHMYRTFCELLGKEDGYCRGRGGSMHIAEFRFGHLGANAIVGGSTAIAAGAAMGLRRQDRRKVVICFIGDGAASNGVTLESFNFAAQAQFEPGGTPVIYVVENNWYQQTGQSIGETTGLDYMSRRAAGFSLRNMEAEVVNGMDVLAVRDAIRRAREKALAGRGPILLEMLTYRFYGHSASDDGSKYRTVEEVAAWRNECPIRRLRDQLVAAGLCTAGDLDRLEQKVRDRLDRALARAVAAAEPDPATLEEGMWSSTNTENLDPAWRTTHYDTDRVRQIPRNARGEIMYRQALVEALTEEMLRDRRVLVYGEEVADFGGAFQVTHGLLQIFGRNRVFNSPISEAAICGTAIGMAMTGLRPVVEIMYIDFILQAMDQVGNQAAKTRYMFGGKATIPMVIRTTVGGGRGYAGQHGQSLEAVLAHFPGLQIAAPSTAYDAKGLLKTAIRDDNPTVFIEHQLLYPERGVVPREEYTVPFGQAVVRREGSDITLVGYSYMARVAMEAAGLLAEQGISAEVVDPRTLYPLDVETLAASAAHTGRVVVLTQSPLACSFAQHIAYRVQETAFAALKAPVRIVSALDVPPPAAPALERVNFPSPERVAQAALALVQPGRLHA